MLEIRAARAEDYDRVHDLEQQGGRSAPLPRSWFVDSLARYTVAVENDRVMGFCNGHHRSDAWENCLVTPAPPDTWTCSYIATLVVDKDARGRGIGSTLLRHFMDCGAAAGSSWLVLHPTEDKRGGPTPELARFYERAGLFLIVPEDEHRRHRPWLMGAPLEAGPLFTLQPAH